MNDMSFYKGIKSLYTKYRQLMYREACAYLQDTYLAEEAVQMSFEKIMNNLHHIDNLDSLKTRNYVITICRHTAIDMQRKIKEIPCEVDEVILEDEVSDPLEIVLRKETVQEIACIIENLDPIYRDVFLLRRVHGHSREEIAKMLNISVEAVKKRLVRAKKQIIKDYERSGKYE